MTLAPERSSPTRVGAAPLSEEIARMLRLAWPITVSELAFMAMGLVDTAILGHVSATELAGSAIGRSVPFTAMMPAFGLTLALEPLASQAVGAGEHARAWSAFVAALKGSALAWLPLMIASFGVLALLESFGIDRDVADRARIYGAAQAPGFLFGLVFLSAKTFLQSHSRTRPMLVAAVVANVVNFALCNVLARGDDALAAVGLPRLGLPALGVLGAGIAFSFAQLVMAAILVKAVWSYRPAARAPAVAVGHVLRLGAPVGAQLLVEAGVFTVATVIIGRFGSHAESAHQVAMGLASFTFMGALGVSGATAVRVGYAIGQGRSPRRAGLVGITIGSGYMFVCATIIALARHPLAEAFTADPRVIERAAELLFIVAVFQIFDGVQAVTAGALRGAGDVRFPFLAIITAHWLIGLPLGLLFGFGRGWGVNGIWWGLAAGLVCAAAFLLARFVRITRGAIARV
jgi:MATE family multidrug resistance protein